jgi:serine/threonine-protein kinase
MAPEQIDGETTRSTDIYAASVVLWEMLTGRRLFLADNHLQTLTNVMAGNAPAPSAFSPNVSPELDLFVLRGLRKDPAERFPSARAMSRALQKLIPIATTGDVGEWVEQMVGANLSSRTQKIASIEGRSSDVSLPPDTTASGLEASAPTTATQSLLPERVRDKPVLFVSLAAAIILGIGTLVGVRLATPSSGAIPPHAASGAAAAPTARPTNAASATPIAAPSPAPAPAPSPPPVPLPTEATADAGAAAPPVQTKSDAPSGRSHSQRSDFSHVMDSRK